MIGFSFPAYAFDPYPINQDPGFCTYRDDSGKITRNIDLFTPPCTCDCDDMIKSYYEQYDQTDDELYLHGGYQCKKDDNTTYHFCQKFIFNLNTCDGYYVSSIKFSFEDNESDCWDHNMYMFKGDGNGNATFVSEYSPSEDNYFTMVFNPSVPACTTMTFEFYICKDEQYQEDCYGETLNAKFEIEGDVPPCERELEFHFDVIPSVPIIIDMDRILKEEKLNQLESNEIKVYKLYNSFGQLIDEFNNSKKNIKNIMLEKFPEGIYYLYSGTVNNSSEFECITNFK